jgi:hypothetical protein
VVALAATFFMEKKQRTEFVEIGKIINKHKRLYLQITSGGAKR